MPDNFSQQYHKTDILCCAAPNFDLKRRRK